MNYNTYSRELFMKRTMLKNFVCIIIAACFAVFLGVSAWAEKSGDFSYMLRDDGTASIIGYSGNSPDVVIPDTIDGLEVTELYGLSFDDRIKTLHIPSSVKDIDYYVFYYATGISEITVDTESEYFTTENGILYNRQMTRLIRCPITYSGEITIPESVTEICESAFSHCALITKVNIPKSVSEILEEAFYECDGLTEINFPNSFIELGSSVFSYCDSLTSVNIPDGILYIGDNMFTGCESLTDVVIEDGILTIGDGAFNHCESLKNITIPDSVTEVGNGVFAYDSSLEDMVFPEGVEKVGYSVFENCSSLKTVNFPASITDVGSDCFLFCEDLTAINVSESNSIFSSIDGVLFNKNKTKLITFPSGKSSNYTIPNGVKQIDDNAFFSAAKLTTVAFPETLETIGDRAFISSGLTEIILPDNITYIGSQAFSRCRDLKSIKLPSGLAVITDDMLAGSNELKSITVPDGVVAIGGYAFGDCASLEEITIPASVKYMGEDVFRDCEDFTIVGTDESYVQEYAENAGIAFRAISETPQAESETPQAESGSNTNILFIIIGAIAALGTGFAIGILIKRG
jgi:hypothetical protein